MSAKLHLTISLIVLAFSQHALAEDGRLFAIYLECPQTMANANPPCRNIPRVNPPGGSVSVSPSAFVTSVDLTRASLMRSSDGKSLMLGFSLSADGERRMADVTTQNVGKIIVFVMDNQAVSVPRIREPISGRHGQAEMPFAKDKARAYIVRLKRVINERTGGWTWWWPFN